MCFEGGRCVVCRGRSYQVVVVLLVLFSSFVVFNVKAEEESYIRIQQCMKQKRFAQVERQADSLIRGGDTSSLVREYLATAFYQQHKLLEEAIELLHAIPASPYRIFLLARLQSLTYQFEASIATFERYIPVADPLLYSDIEAKQSIVECEMGIRYTGVSYRPILYSTQTTIWDSVSSRTRLSPESYHLIPLPAALYGEFDDAKLYPPTLVAYPDELRVGTQVVYPNRKSQNGQRDLYLTELRTDRKWSIPAPLSNVINTPYDEAFALLAARGNTIYFSSKGHSSMGGLDIFTSTFDPITNQWGIPENLGFPYNSPFDDYLLTLPDSHGRILIASNRGCAPDSLCLYTVSYDPAQLRTSLGNKTARKAIALFQGVDELLVDSVQSVQREAARNRVKVVQYKEVESDPEHERLLVEGFAAQRLADSLRKQLEGLRERLWEVKTAEDRRRYEARIEQVVDRMLAAQRSADLRFAKASVIEQEYITGHRATLSMDSSLGAYVKDDPIALYLAKPAASVMQANELKALEEIARQRPVFWKETKELSQKWESVHKLLEDSTSTTAEIGKAEYVATQESQFYVKRYCRNVEIRAQIFSQCLAVSYMKGNRDAKLEIFAAESKANEYKNIAQTLRNNRAVHEEGEVEFLALLLQEIANLYYELGFSYAWNMEKYRSLILNRIAAYEALVYGAVQPQMKGQDTTPSFVMQGEAQVGSIERSVGTVVMRTPQDRKNLAEQQNVSAEGLQILESSPYQTEDDVPRDVSQPSGVVYRLQLGAYSNPIDPALFQGMYPIVAETLQGGKIRKYYAGGFRLKEQADKGKQLAKKCGFPDAFVVAWYNGRKVTLARAQSVELFASSVSQEREVEHNLEKQYSVTIGVYPSELPQYVAETVNLLAPEKEILSKRTETNQNIYYISGFTDLVQAERLRDNLLASGLLEAKVEQ